MGLLWYNILSMSELIIYAGQGSPIGADQASLVLVSGVLMNDSQDIGRVKGWGVPTDQTSNRQIPICDTLVLDDIFIAPEHRHLDFGSTMLKAFFNTVNDRDNLHTRHVETLVQNVAQLRLIGSVAADQTTFTLVGTHREDLSIDDALAHLNSIQRVRGQHPSVANLSNYANEGIYARTHIDHLDMNNWPMGTLITQSSMQVNN
jgi:hypothetical protein